MDYPGAVALVTHNEPSKPFRATEADGDLEYEENALIKIEQKGSLIVPHLLLMYQLFSH
jgi:hypothetical protein